MDSFGTTVRAIVARIPRGSVATYGQVAALAGRPRAARAVGMLMHTNTDLARVPCHRVVGAGGVLVGYAFNGVNAKHAKLAAEGVSFIGDKVDLARSRWSGR